MHDTTSTGRRWTGALLWTLAFLVAAGLFVWQRMTGPTHPQRVSYALDGVDQKARLNRSGTTHEDALVRVPVPPKGWTAELVWRRYPTNDEYAALPMRPTDDGSDLAAGLPHQPTAGKIEYHVLFRQAEATVRVPAAAAEDPRLRFKNAVPLYVWLPHVIVMFLGVLVGFRAGLAALLGRPGLRVLAWITLGGLFLGGLVLGPIMQKIAFGAFWTGWPLGGDLTDNKLLVAWLAWLAACLVIGWRPGRRERVGRVAAIAATLVTLVIFLIPHSARGSELDYSKVREGVNPAEAIKTG